MTDVSITGICQPKESSILITKKNGIIDVTIEEGTDDFSIRIKVRKACEYNLASTMPLTYPPNSRVVLDDAFDKSNDIIGDYPKEYIDGTSTPAITGEIKCKSTL